MFFKGSFGSLEPLRTHMGCSILNHTVVFSYQKGFRVTSFFFFSSYEPLIIKGTLKETLEDMSDYFLLISRTCRLTFR